MSDITRDYSFGGWLRSFRLKRELTLRKAAALIGVDAGNLSKIERSELPPPSTQKKLEALVLKLELEPAELSILVSTAISFHQGALSERWMS